MWSFFSGKSREEKADSGRFEREPDRAERKPRPGGVRAEDLLPLINGTGESEIYGLSLDILLLDTRKNGMRARDIPLPFPLFS